MPAPSQRSVDEFIAPRPPRAIQAAMELLTKYFVFYNILSCSVLRLRPAEQIRAAARLTVKLLPLSFPASTLLAVQNFGGFFTELGSPGTRVSGEKPRQILNTQPTFGRSRRSF